MRLLIILFIIGIVLYFFDCSFKTIAIVIAAILAILALIIVILFIRGVKKSKNDVYYRILDNSIIETDLLDIEFKTGLNNYIKDNWFFIASKKYKNKLFGKIFAVMDYKNTFNEKMKESQEYYYEDVIKDDSSAKSPKEKEQIRAKLNNRFAVQLKKIMRERGLENSYVCSKSGIDGHLFFKIISNDDYVPDKYVALLLCISLELDLNTILTLLTYAKYPLTNLLLSDLIIRYCLENNIYDIEFINDALFIYEQKDLYDCDYDDGEDEDEDEYETNKS